MLIQTGWKPSIRNCVYQDRPEWVPEWVYTQAVAAKRAYNENWEFWVYMTSHDYNCSIPVAEDACIRGLKKSFLQIRHVYGDKIGAWYEQFMDMSDVFNRVKHPEYLPQLGDKPDGR
jgi:hypothetical protein